jgi:hypothetical protein
LAALIIESGHVGRDPLADLDRRVTEAVEALPGVVAAMACLRRPPDQRTVYIAMEPGANACLIRRATRRILRHNEVSVRTDCIRIAPVDGSPAS